MTVDSLSASATFLFCLIYCWHYLRVHIADMSSFCHRTATQKHTHTHTHTRALLFSMWGRKTLDGINSFVRADASSSTCASLLRVSSNFHLFCVCVCAHADWPLYLSNLKNKLAGMIPVYYRLRFFASFSCRYHWNTNDEMRKQGSHLDKSAYRFPNRFAPFKTPRSSKVASSACSLLRAGSVKWRQSETFQYNYFCPLLSNWNPWYCPSRPCKQCR